MIIEKKKKIIINSRDKHVRRRTIERPILHRFAPPNPTNHMY